MDQQQCGFPKTPMLLRSRILRFQLAFHGSRGQLWPSICRSEFARGVGFSRAFFWQSFITLRLHDRGDGYGPLAGMVICWLLADFIKDGRVVFVETDGHYRICHPRRKLDDKVDLRRITALRTPEELFRQ